jgi:hypothetical protein
VQAASRRLIMTETATGDLLPLQTHLHSRR